MKKKVIANGDYAKGKFAPVNRTRKLLGKLQASQQINEIPLNEIQGVQGKSDDAISKDIITGKLNFHKQKKY
ncbi:MAG: hypothetical protein IPO77_01930 [Acidobacteria bacterium]|nr:hypothetical protein [Acidobacteriota bacterium]